MKVGTTPSCRSLVVPSCLDGLSCRCLQTTLHLDNFPLLLFYLALQFLDESFYPVAVVLVLAAFD